MFSLEDIRKIDINALVNKILDIEDDQEKVSSALGVIKNLYFILMNSGANKYINMGWGDIERIFKNEKDLSEKLIILKDIVNQKSICRNQRCDIFPHLSELDLKIDLMEYTDIEKAKVKMGENSPAFKKFSRKFNDLKVLFSKVYSEIYKIYTVTHTVRFEEGVSQDFLLDMYDKAIKASKEGVNVETGIGTGMEQRFQELNQKAGLTKLQDEGDKNKLRIQMMDKMSKIKREREEQLEKIKKQKEAQIKNGKD
jgi:hypothetical protein